ncbi:MAG: tetratricopeptide repeat protein, partial [Gemmatimonadota bacterium]
FAGFRMAQATRTTAQTAGLSDDPLENAADWFTVNRKLIAIVLTSVAAVAALIVVFRYMEASKREKASTALYQAQAPLSQGNSAAAETQLQRVVSNYGGTSSGQQAALILAQLRYDAGKHAEGIAGLESSLGSASDEFKPAFESLIAMGYEAQGKYAEAADHYGKAAASAKFDGEKAQFEASQARHLMQAGKLEEARKIWEKYAQREDQPLFQEARVRLGEIAGAAK